MTRFDTDPWIHKPRGARFPSPAQFHALGVVAYNWNICEEAIRALFADASALPLRARYTITHDMGDVAMVEKLPAVPAKGASALRRPVPLFMHAISMTFAAKTGTPSYTQNGYAREGEVILRLCIRKRVPSQW